MNANVALAGCVNNQLFADKFAVKLKDDNLQGRKLSQRKVVRLFPCSYGPMIKKKKSSSWNLRL